MLDDALRLTLDEVFPTKYQFDKNAITELTYEEYSNDLVHKKEEDKKEGPRIIKRKRFTTICDQGSGTQDRTEEEYQQENIRKKEVVIQKKINEFKTEDIKNNENSAHKAQNEKECIKQLLEKNGEENNDNSNKSENKVKEKEKEKEKPFNQKDYKTPFPVPGYEPWENLWEYICDLNEEKSLNITTSNPNNYTTGIKGLLEIQKKRQTASAPSPIDNNTKRGGKNINYNQNNNNQKDKNIINNNKNIANNNNRNVVNNNNKNINSQKEIKKEKKIDEKKVVKKPNETQPKKNINNKTNNLNKNKEKENNKEDKGNHITKKKKVD
jgi:hypothetical protein